MDLKNIYIDIKKYLRYWFYLETKFVLAFIVNLRLLHLFCTNK